MARERPIPKMDVNAISPRLLFGTSIPEILGMIVRCFSTRLVQNPASSG